MFYFSTPAILRNKLYPRLVCNEGYKKWHSFLQLCTAFKSSTTSMLDIAVKYIHLVAKLHLLKLRHSFTSSTSTHWICGLVWNERADPDANYLLAGLESTRAIYF